MRPPAAEAAYCRLTVLAPRTRVDVALPTDVPVAELVPMVLELVGEPGPLLPEPWRLSGVAGGPLPPGATLGELGLLDGDMLRLAPDAPPPAPPAFDDPVEALAASAGARGAGDRRFGAAAVLAVAVAAALLVAGTAGGPGGGALVAVAALAAGIGVVLAARLARRAVAPAGDDAGRGDAGGSDAGGGDLPDGAHDAGDGDRHVDAAVLHLAAVTAAVAAVPLAAAAGWAALGGASGAAQLLLATAAAGTTAAVAQIALRVVAPALVGVVAAALPVALGAAVVLRFGVTPAAAATGIGAAALVAGPLLPRAALRLAGLPRPVVPADAAELVGADTGPDLLPPDELAERADLARGYLAGLTGGCAAVAAAAAFPAAAAGGWAGPVFAGVTAAVLALRARGFADPAPARALLVGAVAAGLGLASVTMLDGGAAARLATVVALLVAAGVGTAAITRTRPLGSPVARRAIDLLEGVLVAAAVPLALGVMDLYRLVRGL